MSSKRNLSQIMNASAQKLSELERKERQCLAMDHALTRNGEKTIYALAYATMKKDKSRSFSYEVVHTMRTERDPDTYIPRIWARRMDKNEHLEVLASIYISKDGYEIDFPNDHDFRSNNKFTTLKEMNETIGTFIATRGRGFAAAFETAMKMDLRNLRKVVLNKPVEARPVRKRESIEEVMRRHRLSQSHARRLD